MKLNTAEVYDLVAGNVRENKPFSLLRYGDGEGLFAYGYQSLSFTSKYRRASYKHWGELPGALYRRRMSMHLIRSIKECDIAGLPYGFDKNWGFSLKVFTNTIQSVKNKNITTCSANIHIDMDRDGFLRELIKGRKVYVLGCRDISKQLEKFGALGYRWKPISEQHRFAKVKPEVPFYKQVERIELELAGDCFSQQICLMAAGVAGKHLGNIMRNNGGMVIDLGSVFDKWAGIKTRGWIQ